MQIRLHIIYAICICTLHICIRHHWLASCSWMPAGSNRVVAQATFYVNLRKFYVNLANFLESIPRLRLSPGPVAPKRGGARGVALEAK